MGSDGTVKGRRATINTLSASPGRSTPSQKLAVPSNTAFGSSIKRRISWAGVLPAPCARTAMPRDCRSSLRAAAAFRSAPYEVKSAMERPPAAIAPSRIAR